MTRSVEFICLIALPILSYFIGNISPATLVGKLHGVDIRKEGSGNPGTTNVLRTLGKKAAACTLLIDILKGFIPAFLAGIFISRLAAILCGTAALLGHMWPVCFRFRGGKGVATGFGVALAIDWRVGLTALLCALLGVLVTKRMSCGSIACLYTHLDVYKRQHRGRAKKRLCADSEAQRGKNRGGASDGGAQKKHRAADRPKRRCV